MLFNAVPLLVLAALLLTIALGVSLPLLRDRSRMGRVEIAFALVFPCLGIAALVGGLLLLDEPEPVGGHPLVFLGAIVLAAVPAVAFLASWRQLASLGADRSKDLVAMSQLSRDLVQAPDARAVARMLVGEAQVALSGDLVAIALVEDAAVARIVHAMQVGRPVDWLIGVEIDLEQKHEASGIATVIASREPLSVVDAVSSPRVSRSMVERTGVRSVAIVPVVVDDRAIGAIVVGSTTPRVFTFEDLELLQAMSSESALAIERLRSSEALAAALWRERLLGRVSLDVRSELELEAGLAVGVTEMGEALGLSRCFVRLGDDVVAEWSRTGCRRSPACPRRSRSPAGRPIWA